METPRKTDSTKRSPLERAEQQPVVLGKLASGQTVLDRASSHIHESPEMTSLLQEAFRHIRLEEQNFVRAVIDFGRPIGESMCVTTGPQDTITFAQRERRPGLTRFVLNRSPEQTQLLNVVLMKNQKDSSSYILITAFQGIAGEKEPWDPYAPDLAKDFWNNHALVWDGKQIISGTETTEAPQYWERMPPPQNAPAQMPPPHELRISIPTE